MIIIEGVLKNLSKENAIESKDLYELVMSQCSEDDILDDVIIYLI